MLLNNTLLVVVLSSPMNPDVLVLTPPTVHTVGKSMSSICLLLEGCHIRTQSV